MIYSSLGFCYEPTLRYEYVRVAQVDVLQAAILQEGLPVEQELLVEQVQLWLLPVS
jgi:hypothetical protein